MVKLNKVRQVNSLNYLYEIDSKLKKHGITHSVNKIPL